jgi:CDP-diacylglycerol--glycerol-3-phosphate 3-phosphatidyltransferase
MTPAMALTTLRLLFAPVFAWTFVRGYGDGPRAGWLWATLAVVIASELTDAFDGAMARRRSEVTDFGKVYDPTVDSLSRLTAFISFMVCGIIPLWMFLVFMYRDMLMALLRTVCASRGLVLAARKSGKFKAILQAVGIVSVLVVCLLEATGMLAGPPRLWGQHAGFWIVLIPAAFTALSMFDYVIPNWPKIVAMTAPQEPVS